MSRKGAIFTHIRPRGPRALRMAEVSAVAVGVWLVSSEARAEGFRYVDRDGRVHEIAATTTETVAVEVAPVALDLAPGTFMPPPAKAEPEATAEYVALARQAAELYSLPVELVLAVIRVESGFNPRAVSRTGAMGLMQLMPATAAELGVTNPFDPRQNVFGGARYLRMLLNMFDGSVSLALAGYNAGSGAVRRAGKIPAIPETQRYVASVLYYYKSTPPPATRPVTASR